MYYLELLGYFTLTVALMCVFVYIPIRHLYHLRLLSSLPSLERSLKDAVDENKFLREKLLMNENISRNSSSYAVTLEEEILSLKAAQCGRTGCRVKTILTKED